MISQIKQWWREGPGSGDILGINRRNLDLVFADFEPGKFRDLDDKLAAKELMERAGVKVPQTLGWVSSQMEMATLDNLLAEQDSLVLKPSNGFGGKGIVILRKNEAGSWTKARGGEISSEEIRRHAADILSGIFSLDESEDTVICEELIIPHPFFSKLGPEGLCDVRIILEKHVPLQAMCRVPTTLSDGKANLHGGGVGLGVNLDDGLVNGAMVGDLRITKHPDTKLPVLGLQLPDWEECLALAVAASRTVEVDYLGVDIVVDGKRGPLVLEINARPGLAIQIANAQGQPVTTRAPSSRLDKATSYFNWVLLLMVVVSPLGFQWWQNQFSEALIFDLGSEETRTAVVAAREAEDNLLDRDVPHQIEEINLGETSKGFNNARKAAAAGYTRQALRLYSTVLADSSLAPFALNNMAILVGRAGQDSLALAYLNEAVTRFPAYYRGFYNLGLALEKSGQKVKAREAFDRSLALKPNHAPTWAALGSLEFGNKDYAEATIAFGKAIRYDPTIKGSRFKLGLSNRLLKDFPAAQKSFEELLTLDPDNEAAVYWLARTYRDLSQQDSDNRTHFLARTHALFKEFSRKTPRINSMAGTMAFERGDLLVAQKIFEEMSKGKYRPGYHNLALAATALELGNWDLATTAANGGRRHDSRTSARLKYLAQLGQSLANRSLPRLDPRHAPGPIPHLMAALLDENQRLVGSILVEIEQSVGQEDVSWAKWLAGRDDQQDHARAVDFPSALRPYTVAAANLDAFLESETKISDSYGLYLGYMTSNQAGNVPDTWLVQQQLRILRPDYLPLLLEDFQDAMDIGEVNQAIDVGQRIQKFGVVDPHFIFDLAALHLSDGKPRTARKLLRSLPEESRQAPKAIIIEGRLAMAAERYSTAIKLLKGLLKRDPDNLEARFALGEARLDKGEFRSAARELRKAVDLAPARRDIRQALAQSLMKRKKYSDAVHEWSVLLSLEPDNFSTRFNYALCLQRTEDYAKALAQYDTILASGPPRTSTVFNRGLALEHLGRTAEALEAYQLVLELVPTHPASLRKLELLEGPLP